MDVLAQAPQPTITCYHSVKNNQAVKEPYQSFTPTSSDISGKNLQSYNFDNSIDNFGGSFSFTVKEDITRTKTFMDQVQPLDVIVICESGSEQEIDFIGVVTTISIGGMASNLNKSVTVSGKSIEWLFLFYNINTDLKSCVFQNSAANKTFKTDLAKRDGTAGISIKDIVTASFDMFKERADKNPEISNTIIGDLIDLWYKKDYFDSSNEVFLYPISSNLFDSGKITVIDFIKKVLPSPLYEIYGYINKNGEPKIKVRKVPYDNANATKTIIPNVLTDFTLTRTCDEVYTAFMPYVEGSSKDPSFYMNLQAAKGQSDNQELKGYNSAKMNDKKVKLYGYQLLTCSFVGYRENTKNNEETLDNDKLISLADQMEKYFGNLDEMYNGDFTIVNYTKQRWPIIGEWVRFADGMFYIHSASHSWNYGDNPMINYNVSRGGKYVDGVFQKLENLSAVYKEFD